MSEQVSALIDNEVAPEDAEHLLGMLSANKQALEDWSHFHLIGDAMRGDNLLHHDFKKNLMQKIELEPTILAPGASKPATANSGKKEATGFKGRLPVTWSIAASFAAVMMVGWMALQQHTQSGNAPVIAELAELESSDQTIPAEYLIAHQASAPSTSSYYMQSVNYSE
ncbi:MAG: anti-sigma 24 factor [Betaproteobacteria bacterium HGW-Betaproteobacteria-22]|nr:MAG: anti-sigma 24 factor [Betaproteobacteria bacterium HGW-Betaproteobacteria-22]